jgi:protein tyrosine/serine phosphatase
MQDYNKIINNLYLGNKNSLESYNLHKYSLIINCTPDIPMFEACKNSIRLPVKDDPYESDKLYTLIYDTSVLNIIDETLKKEEKVLIHCSMGIQRSCAIVACYLIVYNSMTPIAAITYIRHKRPIAFFGQVNFIKTIERIYLDTQHVNNIRHKAPGP